MNILVTGGCGYIGAHVIKEIAMQTEHNIDVVDNKRTENNYWYIRQFIRYFHGFDLAKHQPSAYGRRTLEKYDVIIHLAANISVEESVKKPVEYWINNLLSTEALLNRINSKTHLIFASTGTAFCPENPYALSKVACEKRILEAHSNKTIFRFFNVSGMCDGIHATGKATHLIRRCAMAAKGEIDSVKIMGDNWSTADGTAVRDYIHVEDIAKSIVNAIRAGKSENYFDCLGSGSGYSVNEVIDSMKKVTGINFKTEVVDRRVGDVASMICPSQYKYINLQHSLDSMCLSAFNENTKQIR